VLRGGCLVPWASALGCGRQRDLDGDGSLEGDSGADFWTAYAFHTRDMLRQAVFDQMFVTRVLARFDGQTRYDQDGDGAPDLAGDFDGDGVVDLGGPNVGYFAWGESLGGIVSSIHGAVDHHVVATAPTAGGGGLSDIGVRSFQSGVVEAVMLRAMGPLVVSVPAEARIDWKTDASGKPVLDAQGKPVALPDDQQTRTACHAGQSSVRWVAVERNQAQEAEIACVDGASAQEGADVVVTNGTSGEVRCGRITKAGSDFDAPEFRVPIPASQGDPIAIQIYAPIAGKAQVLESYGKTCTPPKGALPALQLTTWQGFGASCTAGRCASLGHATFAVGSRLVAPADGYGLRRQTPEFRRFMQLAQLALDPADPITFAPYYFTRPKLDPNGAIANPTALLDVSTIGDMNVPISTGVAFGRAAGALPFLRAGSLAAIEYPDYVAPEDVVRPFQATPNQVLIDGDVLEGVARLARHPAGASCKRNWNVGLCGGGDVYDPASCQNALFDVDDLSEGAQPFAQQRLSPPLRIARLAKHATLADLEPIWAPRTQPSWTPTGPLAATLEPYVVPTGVHGFDPPDPCKTWDDGSYLVNTLAHFFRSGGTDLYYASHPATHECAAITSPTNGCDWGD
jgi:hypothetical protein